MPSRKQRPKAKKSPRSGTKVEPTPGTHLEVQNGHTAEDILSEDSYYLGDKVIPEHEDNSPFPVRPYTDYNIIDTFKELEVQRDYLDFFTEPCKGSAPSWDAELIQDFCKHDKIVPRMTPQVEIQMNDREYGSNRSRNHPKFLNAEQLRHALGAERFGRSDMPDASRRQIMIRNIDAQVVHALAETAASHQADTLRDSISKHISGETSMKFQKQADGLDQPRIELHLPYLALRKVPHGTPPRTSSSVSQHEEMLSSFFVPNLATQEGDHTSHCIIHEASVSIVLSIWDRSKWVAYAFSKPCPSEDDQEGGEESEDPEYNAEEDDCEDEGAEPAEDIFVPDNGLHNLSADDTIWDPRRYYLCVVAMWIDLVQREYKYLVHTLDANVKAWRIATRNQASDALYHGTQNEYAAKSLQCTVETTRLLREVREHMLPAIRAWDAFAARDLALFADLNDRAVDFARDNIRSSFGKLVELEQKLVFLENYCSETAKTLQLRLTVESNNINRHAHDLNMQTNLISRDIHQLNRTSTNATIANVKAAKATSWTTQINVLMIWITTPLVVVLQYFGSERAIFSFERTPRTFVIALFIVFFTLPVITLALHSVDRIKKAILSILGVAKKMDEHTEESLGGDIAKP